MAERRTGTPAIEAAYRRTELFERRRRLKDSTFHLLYVALERRYTSVAGEGEQSAMVFDPMAGCRPGMTERS